MLRGGLVGLTRLFCVCKKLATPLEFAESQVGVEEGSPSVWQYLPRGPRRNKERSGSARWWQSRLPHAMAYQNWCHPDRRIRRAAISALNQNLMKVRCEK